MKDIQTQLATELAELDQKIAPPSGHRISLKGKLFTFPDGKTSPGPITAVILDWRNVNVYYQSAYNPQKIEAPTCFALSRQIPDLAPSESCADPQGNKCEGCQWNAWGSATGGGRRKQCKNGIRIAIVPPDAMPDTPPCTIDLAPSSTSGFTNFVNNVKGQLGMLPLQVQATVAFDQSADYPKLTFANPEPLPEELIEKMFRFRQASQPLLDKEPGT
jgi:hypothetical protein